MRRWKAAVIVLMSPGIVGCAHVDWAETAADTAFQIGEHATRTAVGDNAGPLFTGEKRGEYRDRKEVERLGHARFRRTHGRDPDLYLAPHSSHW